MTTLTIDQAADDLMALAMRCFSRFGDDVKQAQLREAIERELTAAYQRGVRDAVDRLLASEANDQRDWDECDIGLDGRPNSERE